MPNLPEVVADVGMIDINPPTRDVSMAVTDDQVDDKWCTTPLNIIIINGEEVINLTDE